MSFCITLHSKQTFKTGYYLVLNSRMYLKSLRQSWERSQALSVQIELKFMMWMRDLLLHHSHWDPCASNTNAMVVPAPIHIWHLTSSNLNYIGYVKEVNSSIVCASSLRFCTQFNPRSASLHDTTLTYQWQSINKNNC